MKRYSLGLALLILVITGRAQSVYSNSTVDQIIAQSYNRHELEKIARSCLNFPLSHSEKLMVRANQGSVKPDRRISSPIPKVKKEIQSASSLAKTRPHRRLDPAIVARIDRYAVAIRSCCRTHRLDENLVKAVIYVESGGNPKAVSSKGAMGLMQLMPFNLSTLGVRSAFVPQQNIQGGTRLLSILNRYFDQDEFYMLWAYHAGMQRVDSGIMPEETRRYIVNVKRIQNLYRIQGDDKNV